MSSRLIVTHDDGTEIESANIYMESMNLVQSICSGGSLRFGSCEASKFSLKIVNDGTQFQDKLLNVAESVDGQYTPIGKFKVNSAKPTAERTYRDIVAYDAMYDILKAEMSDWYNSILPDENSSMTLKQFRSSFFDYLGITQEVVDLPNDNMVVTRTVSPSTFSGKTVITCICEINGCFGHINPDGVFTYIFLPEILDSVAKNVEIVRKAKYDDFVTERINKLQIRQEENDIGVIYGTGDNCYIVQDNFLLYGKSSGELQNIAANLYAVISKVAYRPANVQAIGDLSRAVGDVIKFSVRGTTFYTYILQRTLTGIQALRDTYEASGTQYQEKKVNSVHESIRQLKGKSNVLERTIEETKQTIKDVEQGLSNEIRATASEFDVKIQDMQKEIDGDIKTFNIDHEPNLQNYPAYNFTNNIRVGISFILNPGLKFEYTDESYRKYARSIAYDENSMTSYRFVKENGIWCWKAIGDSEFGMVMQRVVELEVTTENITQSVSEVSRKVYNDFYTKAETESKVKVSSDQILQEVSSTYTTKKFIDANYETIEHASTRYEQTDKKIELRVEKGKVSSQISQEADLIHIRSNRFKLESTNCTIDTDGTITANKVNLSGKITATSGKIGGFDIGTNNIHFGRDTLEGAAIGVYIGNGGISLASELNVGSVFSTQIGGGFIITHRGDFYNIKANQVEVSGSAEVSGTVKAYTGKFRYLEIGASILHARKHVTLSRIPSITSLYINGRMYYVFDSDPSYLFENYTFLSSEF